MLRRLFQWSASQSESHSVPWFHFLDEGVGIGYNFFLWCLTEFTRETIRAWCFLFWRIINYRFHFFNRQVFIQITPHVRFGHLFPRISSVHPKWERELMCGQHFMGCSPPCLEHSVRGRGSGGPLFTGLAAVSVLISSETSHISSSVCPSSGVLTAASFLPLCLQVSYFMLQIHEWKIFCSSNLKMGF